MQPVLLETELVGSSAFLDRTLSVNARPDQFTSQVLAFRSCVWASCRKKGRKKRSSLRRLGLERAGAQGRSECECWPVDLECELAASFWQRDDPGCQAVSVLCLSLTFFARANPHRPIYTLVGRGGVTSHLMTAVTSVNDVGYKYYDDACRGLALPGPGIPSLANAMADDEVLFDDVYELCEIIGKWVITPPPLQQPPGLKLHSSPGVGAYAYMRLNDPSLKNVLVRCWKKSKIRAILQEFSFSSKAFRFSNFICFIPFPPKLFIPMNNFFLI